jgi:uncharacterized membrane protein
MDATSSLLDVIAFVWFVLAIGGYRLGSEWGPWRRRSIVAAVQAQRLRWMRNMAARDNRMIDGIVLSSLSQGNAFFASTSGLAIGGLVALVGSGDQAQAFLERVPYVAKSSPMLWEIKVVLLIAIFVYAFFKFAWAFRLSHYTGIMIGATPIATDSNTRDCEAHAERTADLIGIAAEHANGGLRAYYYAIAALAWFFHPVLFMIAATWVVVILARRDFFSRSLTVISGA